jgi:hypothetical protein
VTVRDKGTTVDADLRDISPGGARLAPTPALKTGTPVTIRTKGSSRALEGRVVDVRSDGAHVVFDREYDIDFAMLRRESLRPVA